MSKIIFDSGISHDGFLGNEIRLFDGFNKDKYDIQIVDVIPSSLTTPLEIQTD